MLNTCNIMLGNNTAKEIKASKYPYIKKKPAGISYFEFIELVTRYFEALEHYEQCILLKDYMERLKLSLPQYCACSFPIYTKVYKVRLPKCTSCGKKVLEHGFLNERFKTHSHSHCVSHSSLKSLFRNRMRKRNGMRE